MDPDGLSTTAWVIALLAAAALAAVNGAYTTGEQEKDQSFPLGYPPTAAGLAALFALACGLFVYGLVQWALPGWLLAAVLVLWAAAVCGLWTVGGGFGGAICGLALLRPVFWAARVLGALLTLPARGAAAALHLGQGALVTEEDLLSMVESGEEQDLIDESQKEMITNIFELDDVTAGDIMTHRTEVVGFEEELSSGEAVRLATEEGFSRLPVYRKSLDNVVGILYIKDLFAAFETEGGRARPVREFMRSAMFVPEACRARELLLEFKQKHTQIAIVVDEYGGTSGLVTMEDVLEEIVGNIQDEFDNEEEQLTSCEDGGFVCDGALDLEELFDAFDLELPEAEEDADYDSVSGLITERLGRIPQNGEEISIPYCGLLLQVLEVGERRILKVKCTREPAADPGAQG